MMLLDSTPQFQSSQIARWISDISDRLASDPEYDSFHAMCDTSHFTRRIVSGTIDSIHKALSVDEDGSPFWVFLFWSPSRTEMLPNSDLDIGFVIDEKGSSWEVENILQERFWNMLFDKIDVANWNSIPLMRRCAEKSIVDGNKAIDARFIGWNTAFSRQYNESGIQESINSLERQFLNYLCEEKFLHTYDYPRKVSQHWPNLKYDAGAWRDMIFFNWFCKLLHTYHGKSWPAEQNTPQLLTSLEYTKQVTWIDVVSDVDLISLVKNSALECGKEDNSRLLRYLNQYTIDSVFQKTRGGLKRLGIHSSDQLMEQYVQSKNNINRALENQLSHVILLLLRVKWRDWVQKYVYVLSGEFGVSELLQLLKWWSDQILRNIALWKCFSENISEAQMSGIINILLGEAELSFADLMAVLSQKNVAQKDLIRILECVGNLPEYDYIKWMVYKHKNMAK